MGEGEAVDLRSWFLSEYQRSSQRLYLVAFGVLRNDGDALDAMQEAALRVFRRLDVISGVESLGSYLATTVRNVALDMVRARTRHDTHSGQEMQHMAAEPEPAGPCEDELAKLEGAIQHLPVDYREVLYLRYREDLNAKQIASRVGISHVNARARLSRAHRALRREMEEAVRG